MKHCIMFAVLSIQHLLIVLGGHFCQAIKLLFENLKKPLVICLIFYGHRLLSNYCLVMVKILIYAPLVLAIAFILVSSLIFFPKKCNNLCDCFIAPCRLV